MKKLIKSDYTVLDRNKCQKPRGTASNIFIKINKLMICLADEVCTSNEGKFLDMLQENRQIIRLLPSEMCLVPLIKEYDKERLAIVEKRRKENQRIIVSTEIWYQYQSIDKKGFSFNELQKKIDEVIETVKNSHLYEYETDGTRQKIEKL